MPGARAPTAAGPAGTQGAGSSDPEDIALFPLGTVLFPGGPLPLRIFETRYIDLVRRCLRENTGFGVVLITEGSEAGGTAPQTADVGCYATIVDFSQQPDGLLGIEALGRRRFRIGKRWQAPDGLNLASVTWLPDVAPVAVPDEFAEHVPVVDNVLDQLGGAYASMERRLDDATWIAARLAEILPVPAQHKQHCLELDDPIERLRYLRPMFEIERQEPQ
jgi:Lon protease-like protein